MVLVDGVKRKICLLGDWGVGKTSLIKKFVLDQFDDTYLATFGSKVYKKNLIYNETNNITNLNLMIWDVMGQPEFKQMRTIAYSGSQGAMIVCDVTRKQSLYNLAFWQAELYSMTKEIPILILANKNDLQNQAAFSADDLNKVSRQLKAHCFFTSAKTGENVEAAFRKIGTKLI